MPLLQGGMGNAFRYSYFPAGTYYGEAERWVAPPPSPAAQPTPSGLPTSTTGLISTAQKIVQPITEAVRPATQKLADFAKTEKGPWWIVGGLAGLYLLARR